jgi:four helix bundle protein
MQTELKFSPKTGRFEFQNWPVYQRALLFVKESFQLCDQFPKDSATGLRDQFRRASQSIPLNIAEACSRYSSKDKANFWRVAKGSVFECVAILDLIRTLNLVKQDVESLHVELEHLGKMLSGLIRFIEQKPRKSGDAIGATTSL